MRSAKPATAPIARVAKGAALYCIQGADRAARWYGRKDATSRWDDPDGEFGVLYLGRTRTGPLAETLLRTPNDRDVLWSRAEQKRQAAFGTVAPLRLAKLHGEGLAWFGVTAAEIADAGYAVPLGLARRIHGAFPIDGLQYRSRFDNDQLGIELFDRADSKIELLAEGQPIKKAWTRQILTRRGNRLIDL